jgi:hypothetical protein
MSEASTSHYFVAQGVDYAVGVLRVVHGDHSSAAKRLMPTLGEGVAWVRAADKLPIGDLDPDWWAWYVRRGSPPADLEGEGEWTGEVRGKGEPEPPLPGTAATRPPAKTSSRRKKPPIDLGAAFPRVKAMLASHEVDWMIVSASYGDLFPLHEQDPAIMVAFGIEVESLGDLAGQDPWALEWVQAEGSPLVNLAISYGIGRLALGTVHTHLVYSQDKRTAARIGEEFADFVERLRFRDATNHSPRPAALAAAIEGVSAEEVEKNLRDPVKRLEIESYRRGFLVAVAEEALAGGRASSA